MNNIIEFKSNKNLLAIKTSNSFGDQIIAVLDISKDDVIKNDPDFPHYAGMMVFKHTSHEGDWINFTEKNLLNIMPKIKQKRE